MPDYTDLSYAMAGAKRSNPFDARRRFATQLLQSGADTSPVLHPLQGVGRLAQALAGGWIANNADNEERATRSELAAKIAEAGKIKDPTERGTAFAALDPEIGLKYAAQAAADEAKLKRSRDDDLEAASFLIPGARNTQQAGGVLDRSAQATGGIESGGRYDAVGPVANQQGDRAHGKYQVMGANVGPWTQEILGKAMTPQEFLANPQAQDAVYKGKFGQYVQQYGSPEAASRAWFAGPGGMNNPNAKDVLGTTVQGYGQKFAQAYGPGATGQGMPQGDNVGGGTAPRADGSGNALPPAPGGDAGAQYEAAARAAHAAGRGDVAMKYMQQATAARETAAQRDTNRNIQHVDLGDSIGILDPRTGQIVQRIPKGTKPGAGEGGAFGGTGMENQARSALVKAAQDPTFAASPAYAAALGYLSKPRQVLDEARGVMVTLPPEDLSRFPQATYQANGQGAPQGMPQQPNAAPPQVGAADFGAPPQPSPVGISGPVMQAGPQQAPGAGPTVTEIQGLPPKPLNGEQAKASGFSTRMDSNNAIINQLANEGTSFKGKLLENLPLVGNYGQSENYQRYERARRSFLNAQLRDESGAAINIGEFISGDKQYFPQPGDTPGAIADAAENRRIAIQSMMIKAGVLKPGQEYRPVDPPAQGDGPQPGAAPQGATQEGATATDPKTGQKAIFRGGQWVILQ